MAERERHLGCAIGRSQGRYAAEEEIERRKRSSRRVVYEKESPKMAAFFWINGDLFP